LAIAVRCRREKTIVVEAKRIAKLEQSQPKQLQQQQQQQQQQQRATISTPTISLPKTCITPTLLVASNKPIDDDWQAFDQEYLKARKNYNVLDVNGGDLRFLV
jgi:hypothetical protein